jgi:hypothetical protein
MDLVDLDNPAAVEPVEVEVEDFTPVRHLSVVGA